MFTKRTSKVEEGTKPYAWGVPTTYQCTWYGYYRAMEVGFTPPVWWDRATKTGSYPNAKDWLANYREPWEVKGTPGISLSTMVNMAISNLWRRK